ncbi:MAG: hypothetical protein M3N17_01655, partial [Actinomycetota bacterium]|nr:hypothetical protein [Actinomycetota bacterium]
SARTGVEAAEAAARSAATAEAALLAESMPFVRPSFGGGSSGSAGDRFTMTVRNSGRHAALNVGLFIGDFPVVEPGDTQWHKWSGDETAERLWDARTGGSVLTTRYSDPYGTRYQVEVQRHVAGEVALQERVFTYRLAADGTRTPLLGS